MQNEEVMKILIAKGEYAEVYAPFPGSKEENDEKIKRGILTRLGMKKEEIDRIIDNIEVLPDRGGADGRFDDGPYTPVKLVKTIYSEPPFVPNPPFSDPDPEVGEENERKDIKPRQTMLQQFYGDRSAEARRVKIFDRFKSHVTKKLINTYDENGNKRSIEVYTIEDYEGKKQDSNELLLDGYQTRLERLSRAHQRDFSPYKREFKRLKLSTIKEILAKYEEMHRVKPDEADKFKQTAMEMIGEFNSSEFEKNVIQALIDQDTEFIETNNYTYNSPQNTAENLKTLGKDGEESVKAPISDEQNFAQKFGLKAMNTMISIRNHTKVPVNKAIGTYIASPIYRALMGVTQAKTKEPLNVDGYLITPMEDMLATSQKHSRGMYKNKPSHRYHARKDFFIEQEKMAIAQGMTNEGKEKEPRVTIGTLLKLAFVPRIRAIMQYKEGNIAVLNAGLYDIEEATSERTLRMIHKKSIMTDAMNRIASYEREIEELKTLLGVTKDLVERKKIEATIKQRELWKAKLNGRLIETEREEIDSVSTDALSMSQHDKANKATITTLVRGFKTAARVASGAYLSKYLYEEVLEKRKTPDIETWIPPKEVEKEVTEEVTRTIPGMDKDDIAKIKLGDICPDAIATVSYDAAGGNQLVNNYDKVRGLCFEFKGKLFSGSDGNGFDPTVLTDVKIDQILDKERSLISYIQEIMQDELGRTVTEDEITSYILSGDLSNIRPWLSYTQNNIPMGWWLEGADKFKKIVGSGSHTITEKITKTVREIIPGRWEIIPGEEYLTEVEKMNPAIIAAELGLAASEIADLNEFLRYTRSQEDIKMRSAKELYRMAKENMRARAATKRKSFIKGTNKEDVPTINEGIKIKSFQRSTGEKRKHYSYQSTKMRGTTECLHRENEGITVFEGFVGSGRKDFSGGYDENLLGTNNPEVTPISVNKDGEEER